MMFAQCGMFFLAAGTDLVTLFIGLELMALSFYVMVGFLRTSKRSNEAAMKYLLLGAFSSGFLAYGFSVMYGISGSTKLAEIATSHRRARAVRSAGLAGAGDHVRRPALQDFGGPVSHVGAGRLRRRADHRHRLSFGGLQGGVYRVPAAHLSRSAGLRAGCLGADPELRRRRHHDGRQPGRHQPEQHQAAAGLQLHLARRLHAARPDCRKCDRYQRYRRLCDGLHFHESGRVPGAGGAAPQRYHRGGYRRYRRA